MTEITENDFAALKREVAEVKRATGPKPTPLNWTDFQEIVHAQHALAREQRRQEAARAEQELRERLKREAPLRAVREKALAAVRREIAEHETELTRLRERYRCLEVKPLQEWAPADPEPGASSPRARLRALSGKAA